MLIAMYSAFMEERAIVFCALEIHDTQSLANLTKLPVTDHCLCNSISSPIRICIGYDALTGFSIVYKFVVLYAKKVTDYICM